MKIVIKDGAIFSIHEDGQNIDGLYPSGEVVTLPNDCAVDVGMPDPRLTMAETERTRIEDQRRRGAAIEELAGLDRFIPRGLEDTWSAMGFDTTALPQVQRVRLSRKSELRAIIAETAYLAG